VSKPFRPGLLKTGKLDSRNSLKHLSLWCCVGEHRLLSSFVGLMWGNLLKIVSVQAVLTEFYTDKNVKKVQIISQYGLQFWTILAGYAYFVKHGRNVSEDLNM
jgi:hypothetical protein